MSAIAIGIVMMLIAIGTGIGLKQNIRDKVAAFNGHIQVLNFDQNNSNVSLVPLDKNQEFYLESPPMKGVVHRQAVILKAGVIIHLFFKLKREDGPLRTTSLINR